MAIEAAWLRNEAKFIVLMALVQFVHSAVNVLVLNKLAADDDMNLMRILVAYRLMFAAAATIPPSLVFEIRKSFPKITWRVIVLASVIALTWVSLYVSFGF